MQKFFYRSCLVLTLISGASTTYLVVTGDYAKNIAIFGLAIFETIAFCLIAVMTKPMQTEKKKTTSLFTLLLITVFGAVLLLSSCSHNGYGCHGRESWKHMERRINRP